MITLKGIKKTFTTRKGDIEAVKGVDLEIENGEIFGVIGYSGAGKSTLIRLFNGLEAPSAGEVSIDGEVISQLKGKELRTARKKIGMVFQHFNLLWSRTVKENILFPLEIAGVKKAEANARALELVKLVGLEGRENAYPAELSGGQKQRVGIARALANEPTLLLCDEATSALDPQTTDEVLDLLLDINERLGLTIVLITHEMHVIRKICNRVAVMEDGKIVEEGKVLDVFKKPQTQVTKRFIQQDSDVHNEETEVVLEEMLAEYPHGKIVRLSFHGEQTKLPIISHIVREHQVEVSIIQGNIQQTKGGAFGSLYVQILGEDAEIDAAIITLEKMRVEIEVMSREN